MVTTVVEIRELYDQGRIPEAMDAARDEIKARLVNDPEIPELWVILAWCHYRHKEYDVVRSCLGEAGDTERAYELWATLAAYVDKDDVRLREIAQRFPGNINVQNALVIRARDADSTIDHVTVLNALTRFTAPTIEGANLYHNAARFLLAKARNQTDISTAFTIVCLAIEKYGVSANWHHRAAAFFWKSKIAEALKDREEALHAAEQSLHFWDEALARDPQNKGFQGNRDNAIKRIAELQ